MKMEVLYFVGTSLFFYIVRFLEDYRSVLLLPSLQGYFEKEKFNFFVSPEKRKSADRHFHAMSTLGIFREETPVKGNESRLL